MTRTPDACANGVVRRLKTDATGEGSAARLAQTTVRLLDDWLGCAQIGDGTLSAKPRVTHGLRTLLRSATGSRSCSVESVCCSIKLEAIERTVDGAGVIIDATVLAIFAELARLEEQVSLVEASARLLMTGRKTD